MFKTTKADQNAFHQINNILGSPRDENGPGWGFAGMIQTLNRAQANVRYYCDNDPQNINGGSRWTLRPDPPNPPPGYIPQRFRQRYDDRNPNVEHQEWEDLTNDIMMGDTNGCLDPGTMAETYHIKRPGTAGQQVDRVTTTICDTTLNSRVHSFDDVPAKKDLSELVNPVQGLTNMDAFRAVSSFTVLHEGMHMLPWYIHDVESPSDPDDGAYSWDDCMDMNLAGDALDNANNYVFFAFLAKLADRHFRLSKITSEADQGKLVYDRHGISSRLFKERRWDELLGGGLVKRWWSA
ncbi:MAG: hypothetical protein Q9160_005693 [Pyrenula sp. 1 TL-2023]